MKPEIQEEPLSNLSEYAQIPIAFQVHSVLEPTVSRDGLGGIELRERPLKAPYTKDYDAFPGNRPTDWADRFDLSHWGMIAARTEEAYVGGAIIAFGTKHLCMLEDRTDLAVLWDLRVSPAVRRNGIGAALFAAAEQWAQIRNCSQLKVETQNVNVPACRFYASQGCELGVIDRFAYPELPGEIQLLWYKALRPRSA